MKKSKHLPKALRPLVEASILEQIERRCVGNRGHNSRVLLGIGDDAALLKPAKSYALILTCDWFLEGTHFLRDKHPADAVGWKCLARALSDVAAMGGEPVCFLLSMALPATHTGLWLDQFLRGLRRAAERFGCPLVGGDTTRNRSILLNVSVMGKVRPDAALRRSTARSGDILFTSGRLGEAERGLKVLRGSRHGFDKRDPALRKHLYPEPRLALGRWLAESRLATSMMDISDGLSTDLPRLCAASGVGAQIQAGSIPSVRLRKNEQKHSDTPLTLALHGGDGYELLFTVSGKNLRRIPRSFRGVSLTPIGKITKERTLLLIDQTGNAAPLPNRGWDPFRGRNRR
ncbi:MAG: thiamine-phosphate kinase [Candidatus Acidiferrum sp.]